MPDLLDLKSLLILAAVATYVLGFLFRDQITTRLLVVAGSLCYIAYYSVAGPTPLWDAIIGSSLIALASIQGVFRLWFSRLNMAVPKSKRHIFDAIGDIEPGLFRQLIRAGDHFTAIEDMVLTREAEPTKTLWFLVNGELHIKKGNGHGIRFSKSGFVGEIAWLTKAKASATVTASAGAELVRWDAKNLDASIRKSQRLELALEALIAHDLARKLATSQQIDIFNQVGRSEI